MVLVVVGAEAGTSLQCGRRVTEVRGQSPLKTVDCHSRPAPLSPRKLS